MKTLKIKSINDKELTTYLVNCSRLAPINEEQNKVAKATLTNLKKIKDTLRRAYTPEEREKADNWAYLLFTIDTLKATLKDYDIIAHTNCRYITLKRYIDRNGLNKDQVNTLLAQYTLC